MPGFGGTQRLAARGGPERAKKIILSRRQIRPDQARRLGLVRPSSRGPGCCPRRSTAPELAGKGPVAHAPPPVGVAPLPRRERSAAVRAHRSETFALAFATEDRGGHGGLPGEAGAGVPRPLSGRRGSGGGRRPSRPARRSAAGGRHESRQHLVARRAWLEPDVRGCLHGRGVSPVTAATVAAAAARRGDRRPGPHDGERRPRR